MSSLRLDPAPGACLTRVRALGELPAALHPVGFVPSPAVAVVAGAGLTGRDEVAGARPLLASALAPVPARVGAVAVDAGIGAGVVEPVGGDRGGAGEIELETHHTHVALPGRRGGAEAPWLSRVVGTLGRRRSAPNAGSGRVADEAMTAHKGAGAAATSGGPAGIVAERKTDG